ncbi:hypothetical protein [Tropicimonas sp.]|uniref:hypothetical protein n=1 Tax=Tropicimonas sp. TaxID=2067044 RepID=UPI003A8802EE
MLRLTLLLHALVSTVLMGVGIVAVLVLGYISAQAIAGAIAAGFIVGFPVARHIAKKLCER